MRRVKYELEQASADAPPAVTYAPEPYSELNKADLKALAASRGLSVSGTKAEIIARLEE